MPHRFGAFNGQPQQPQAPQAPARQSLLHEAARERDVEKVKSALRKKINVNMVDGDGHSCLNYALLRRDPDFKISKMLMEAGAVVNETDILRAGTEPLQFAAAYGTPDLIRYLISKGYDPDNYDEKGFNALHFSISGGKIENIAALLDCGADLLKPSKFGRSALLLAVAQDKEEVLHWLLKTEAVKQLGVDGLKKECSPLMHAISMNKYKTVKILLEAGADPNIRDDEGNTALHIAMSSAARHIPYLLYQYGADIESRNSSGLTPLHVAACSGRHGSVEDMLKFGADPNARTNQGSVALSYLTGLKDIGTAALLLKAGADPNATSAEGVNLVANAIRSKNAILLKKLIEYGADIKKPCGLAASPMIAAALRGHKDTMQVLLDAGCDINAKNEHGYTPLHTAVYCAEDPAAVVRFLLKRGADPSLVTHRGKTAYDLALEKGEESVTEVFVNMNANKNGQTPWKGGPSPGRLV